MIDIEFDTMISPDVRENPRQGYGGKIIDEMREHSWRKIQYVKRIMKNCDCKNDKMRAALKEIDDLEILRQIYNKTMKEEWHAFDDADDFRFRCHGHDANEYFDAVRYVCRAIYIDLGPGLKMTLFDEQHDCEDYPEEYRCAYFVSDGGADYCNWQRRDYASKKYEKKFQIFGKRRSNDKNER